MFVALRSTWPLLLGLALIMLGSGLQSSLLGVRAAISGFPTAVTGLVMSGYFVGFLAGSAIVPRLVQAVGHVRVFAALASFASTAVLVHAVFVEPVTWFAMRFVTGFCSAGLYIVAESWLNDKATNETRGQLLAAYMIVVLVGIGAGQFLLNLADPASFVLFTVASILISLALIPILLTATPAPEHTAPARISLRQLYRISPLAFVSCIGVGIAQSSLWGMAAVYAENIGFSVPQITLFGGAIFLGAVLCQWPLGRLSDRLDRRRVLTAIMLVAAAAAAGGFLFGGDALAPNLLAILIIGGMCMPAYSVLVAYANDFLKPEQMVAASAGLYFVYGLGASLGPSATAGVMTLVGPEGFYVSLAVAHGAVFLFALWRMTRRPSVPLAEQHASLMVASQASPIATELAVELLQEDGGTAPR